MSTLTKHLPTFALAATCLVAVPLSGQTIIAAWGGANIANMAFYSSEDNSIPDGESVTRMSLGASVAFMGARGFGIQLGGAYAQKGVGQTFVDDGVPIAITLETDYVEFGAFARASLGSSERVNGHLLAGVALALEASCDDAIQFGSGVPVREACHLNPSITLSGFDFGPAVGGGLGVRLTDRMGVELGALYTHGLRDLHEAVADEVRHRVWTLRGGFAYTVN